MDWTSIILTLIGTGGIVSLLLGIVTLVERKSAAMLENAKTLAESYQHLAEEYQAREAATQALLRDKELEIVNQIRMNSSLRHNLDDAHTECAVAKLMYCKKTKCVDRDPPFGSDAGKVVTEIRNENKRSYNRKTDE